MSWEDQGRQFHQWFGHGTAGGVADAGPGTAGTDGTRDVAGAVGAAAVAALGGARGRTLARVLAAGGAQDLADALPIWVATAGLAADRFRTLVVGPGFGVAGAASLQAMARVVARSEVSGSGDDAKVAGAHLAAALGGERQAEWGYKLNYVRDTADYAVVNELLPTKVNIALPNQLPGQNAAVGGEAAASVQAVQYTVPSVPFAPPIPSQAIPGSSENERVTTETTENLKTIAAALQKAAQFMPSILTPGMLNPATLLISAMRPPADAKDKDGAKAPGKPGVEEEFEDPKSGEEWVDSPNGRGRGWKHADGSVWVPTGQAGAPGTGTTGPAHGGPHWDVQNKDGSFRNSVYPGGFKR